MSLLLCLPIYTSIHFYQCGITLDFELLPNATLLGCSVFQLWPLEIFPLTPGSFCYNPIIFLLLLFESFLTSRHYNTLQGHPAWPLFQPKTRPSPEKPYWWWKPRSGCCTALSVRNTLKYLIPHLVLLQTVFPIDTKDQLYHFKPKSNFYLPSYHQMLPQWMVFMGQVLTQAVHRPPLVLSSPCCQNCLSPQLAREETKDDTQGAWPGHTAQAQQSCLL